MKKLILYSSVVLVLSGCTSIEINNSQGFQAQTLKQICIIENPKVTINGFSQSIARSFARYQIQAQIYPANSKPLFCQTSLNYTARRSWDMTTYLSYAQFTLIQDGHQVSQATFELRNKGGLALNKWRSVDTKIDELVDQLLEKTKNKP
ncbi:Sbal_3080 family lipoprotein [Acinetobacter sp. MB5]|uniref:Sbal_3080 family lipoprotein n=1 Tax=Acinetobacter sp. MB5 TaxID=2069438 RepID=UPI000DCF8093|nr:Sbal_3080 family lipoprotein [Acinetobacter sp. MB5]